MAASTSGRTAFNLLERQDCKITIGGKTMTMSEYKKMLADKKKAEAKAEREKAKADGKRIVKKVKVKKANDIDFVSQKVQELMRTMPTLKSIPNYRNHSFKAFGRISREILSHHSIKKPMTEFCIQYRELNELIEQVEMLAKRNEKAAYQYVEKIIWKLDDMRTNINLLTKAVNESGVCVRFKDEEAINGKGKALGLATIVKKCAKTIAQMENAVKELEDIIKNGIDPLEYGNHLSVRSKALFRV